MEIVRKNNFNVIHLHDGNLVSKAVKLINSGKADGINFNFISNHPSNINEIAEALKARYIQINDYSGDFDYGAIKALTNLEYLAIYTSDKKEINYKHFPFLRETALFWRPKASSLFMSKNLEHLFISKYTEPDLAKFEGLSNLKYLRINTGSVTSLKGIENLINLETLLLTQATKLKDITEIEKLTNLQHLTIDNCRNILDINVVSRLTNLTTLIIRGSTPNLDEQKTASNNRTNANPTPWLAEINKNIKFENDTIY